MPIANESVRYTLQMNRNNLNDFIRTFQTEREEADFIALKNKMREVLNDMWDIHNDNAL